MLLLPVRVPAVAGDVGEELALAVLDHDGAPLAAHMGEVLAEDEVAVLLEEKEAVEPPLGARGAAPVVGRVVLARRRGVGEPPHGGAPELVGDLLVVAHAEHEAVGVLGRLGLEVAHAAAGAARRALQVRLRLLVRVAAAHPAAVVLGEGHGQVRVHHGGEAARVAPGVAAEELVQVEALQALPHQRPHQGQQAQHDAGVEAAPQRGPLHLSLFSHLPSF
jgi:hypothetical protein